MSANDVTPKPRFNGACRRLLRAVHAAAVLLLFSLSLATVEKAYAEKGKKEPEAAAPPASAPPPGEVDLGRVLEPNAGIEFVCETEVYYHWQRQAPPPEEPSDSKAPPAAPELKKTFYSKAGESGLAGYEVKARLTARMSSLKAQAMTYCRRMHHSEAHCLTARLQSQAETYRVMDFGARRALLSAIEADCRRDAGSCIEAETTPIECHLSRSPELPVVVPPTETKDPAKGKGKK